MSTRTLSLIGFLSCAALIAIALYFQYQEGLDPCPLCIFQRIAFIAMGLFFLLCFLHNPQRLGRGIYGFFASIAGGIGIAIAARHVWLQNLPEDQVPECGPGLDYMIQALPFKKLLDTVLRGSGECAEVSWTLFKISMPGWSLIFLVILTLLALTLLLKKRL